MATTFKEKVSAGFVRAGQETKKKLDKTEAASTYERIDNLGDLAYKDLITAEEVHPEFLPSMKGPQGDQGFGFYGGYVTLNATLAQWKVYGTVGSTFAWTCDTTNIREGDYGIVTGRVTDLGHTGAQIIYKVTAKTNTGVNGITVGFLCGEKGYHFTPSVDGKGNISWTNNGGLTNPTTQNIRGYHYTPYVDGKGNLSWTNNGELENPATQNIRGYHFVPSVDASGNISWTNNGDLDNPETKNILGPRGFHFTPSVTNEGVLSWTNNGNLSNPSPKSIRGPQGFTFIPSIDALGRLTWTNDGGLDNPGRFNLTPRSVRYLKPIVQISGTYEELCKNQYSGGETYFAVTQEEFNASHIDIGDVAVLPVTITDREAGGAFEFVRIFHTNQPSDETKPCQLQGNIIAILFSGVDGEQGPKGDKGDPFVFSDFTAAQIESLRGPKGDKGDGLKFEDLTQDQIAQIKGPKGDDGKAPQVSFRLDDAGNLYYNVTYN